jgi:ABC-type antimicrobial peptide transport system permease subunit
MGRLIGSVIVGYLVTFGVVFVTFSGAYLAIGPDRAFQPGTYDVSMLWGGLSIVLGFVAAVIGGMVCAMIAKDPRGPKWLAVLVLVLGLAFAYPVLRQAPVSEPRTAGVGNMEAMGKARQPPWAALLNPVIGVLGVMVGGRRRSGAAA